MRSMFQGRDRAWTCTEMRLALSLSHKGDSSSRHNRGYGASGILQSDCNIQEERTKIEGIDSLLYAVLQSPLFDLINPSQVSASG